LSVSFVVGNLHESAFLLSLSALLFVGFSFILFCFAHTLLLRSLLILPLLLLTLLLFFLRSLSLCLTPFPHRENRDRPWSAPGRRINRAADTRTAKFVVRLAGWCENGEECAALLRSLLSALAPSAGSPKPPFELYFDLRRNSVDKCLEEGGDEMAKVLRAILVHPGVAGADLRVNRTAVNRTAYDSGHCGRYEGGERRKEAVEAVEEETRGENMTREGAMIREGETTREETLNREVEAINEKASTYAAGGNAERGGSSRGSSRSGSGCSSRPGSAHRAAKSAVLGRESLSRLTNSPPLVALWIDRKDEEEEEKVEEEGETELREKEEEKEEGKEEEEEDGGYDEDFEEEKFEDEEEKNDSSRSHVNRNSFLSNRNHHSSSNNFSSGTLDLAALVREEVSIAASEATALTARQGYLKDPVDPLQFDGYLGMPRRVSVLPSFADLMETLEIKGGGGKEEEDEEEEEEEEKRRARGGESEGRRTREPERIVSKKFTKSLLYKSDPSLLSSSKP